MAAHKIEEVTVSQMRFGKSASREKETKKLGRHLKYPGDPKQKCSVSIRKSFIDKKPEKMNTTDFFEACIASSMLAP